MAYLSLHNVESLTAFSHRTSGAPLIITVHRNGREGDQVTIFTGDQAYTDALIEAINSVKAAREAATVVAFEPEAA